MQIRWQDDDLDLLPQRGLRALWDRTLFIADVHLGKPAAYRAAGIPVPDGSATADLARLSTILARLHAARLVILGDLIHAPAARSPETLDALRQWRTAHAHLPILLIRGNHDHTAGDPPAALNIHATNEPHLDRADAPAPDLHLCHQPPPLPLPPGAAGILCGHLHPVISLRAPAGGSLRARCFHVAPRLLILPAFGSFTGGHPVSPRPGDRIFAINDHDIAEVPMIPATSVATGRTPLSKSC